MINRNSLGQVITLIVTLSLLLLLTGCGETKNSDNTGTNGKNTSYTIADPTGDWGFPSPYAHYARGPGYVRMSFIFDTLIWKNEQDFIPALAEKWEYLPKENAYLFNLQNNVSWHDGQKFSAKDVVFTFNYVKEHPYQWLDSSIIKSIETVNENSVKIYLNKPYAPFLNYIAGTMPILPEHIWTKIQEPLQYQEKDALIGTGPYKLMDYNKKHGTYLYQAFDQYYLGKPKVEKLIFSKTSSEMAVNALKQGQVNAVQVQPELVGQLKKEGFEILTGSHDWVAKLVLNHKKEPLNNRDFRQALAYAINRQDLVDTCLRGHGLIGSSGLIPSDSPWYNPKVEKYSYNKSKAEELLSGLGYVKNDKYYQKDGKTLELELLFSAGGIGVPGAPGIRQAELLKEQLESIGIKINLRSLEAKTLDNMVVEWKFDLALSGHGGLGGDPEIMNKSISGKGFNSARYQLNEDLNKLLSKQLQELNSENRKALVNQIQEIYAQEMPCLTLYYPTWYWGSDNLVKLYYTKQGIGSGVPIPLNKMSFVK